MANLEWVSLTRDYEGFPLYLRFPRISYDALQPQFPVLFVVTHTFNFRRFDGSPEPTYNERLEEFDLSSVSAFDASNTGQIVLVETFGGKRHYYYYVASSVNVENVFRELQSQYPHNKIEYKSRDDPSWAFIKGYKAEFFPEG